LGFLPFKKEGCYTAGMNSSIIKQLIQEFHQEPLLLFQGRDLSIPLNSKKIITLIGPRRAGKTSELFNLMHALLEQGVSKEQIFYLSCEDERFEHTAEELGQFLEVYQTLYPNLDLSSCYFFFDEIQLFDKWDRFIRRLYDKISQHIFLTGSNAKLLSREIATELRGRSLSYSVLPLSFLEYCAFQNIDFRKRTSKNIAVLRATLEQYLRFGGFPELLNYDNHLKIAILQEYFNVMFYRDLVERFEISNVSLFKFFIKRLISSATKEFSVNKIYNELKSSGYKISKDSLYSFTDNCEAIYLAIPLKKYSPSIIHQELTEKKVYVIDNGLFNAINPKFSENMGKLIEQAVFIKLLQNQDEIFFHKQKYECDFLIKEGMFITRAIQVCYDLSDPQTYEREIRGLLEACQTYELTEGLIITDQTMDSIEQNGITVRFQSLLDFLCDL
jgi:predicted AAA+ superfamily ATPase